MAVKRDLAVALPPIFVNQVSAENHAHVAYLGMLFLSGLASGRIFDVLIAGAIMAYLLKVLEAFYVRDDAQNLSLLQESESDKSAPLHCVPSATN
jgi:hypothetical protein